MRRAVANATGTNVAVQLLGAVSGILLARMLGAEGRGELAAIVLWPTVIAAVFLFGVDSEISRRGAMNSESKRSLFYAACSATVILSGIGILFGLLALPFLLPTDKAYLIRLGTIALVVIPASMINVLLFSMELGRGRYREYNITRAAFSPIYVFLLLGIFLFAHPTVEFLLVAYLVAAFLSAGLTLVVAWRGVESQTTIPRRSKVRDLVGSSLPYAGSSVLQIVSAQLPRILVVALADTRAVGVYAVALVVASAHSGFGNAMSKLSFSASARADVDDSLTWFPGKFRCTIVIYSCICIAMLLVAPPLVPLVFGVEFEQSSSLLYPLVPAMSMVAMSQIIDHTLRGRRSVSAGVKSRLLGCLLILISSIFWVPSAGVYGLAMAVLVASAVELILLIWLTSKQLGLPLSDLICIRGEDIKRLYASLLAFRVSKS